MSGGDLLRLAEDLRRLTRDADVALIVNHRVDVALAVEADGVHLGWRSMPVEAVRRLAGDGLRVGVSCHDAEQVAAARAAGADYATLGPVYPTPSKEGLVAPLGTERLARIVSEAGLPVVAIGGIKSGNAAEVRAAGVAGIAVISAIIAAPRPDEAARALL